MAKQKPVLDYIKSHPECTNAQIGAALGIDPREIGATTSALNTNGLVDRVRRSRTFFYTEAPAAETGPLVGMPPPEAEPQPPQDEPAQEPMKIDPETVAPSFAAMSTDLEAASIEAAEQFNDMADQLAANIVGRIVSQVKAGLVESGLGAFLNIEETEPA